MILDAFLFGPPSMVVRSEHNHILWPCVFSGGLGSSFSSGLELLWPVLLISVPKIVEV